MEIVLTKKGLFFLMMYEDNIKIKKFGQDPQTMSWEEFFEITKDIFKESAAGADTWKNHFTTNSGMVESTEPAIDDQIPGQMEVKDYLELLLKNSDVSEGEKQEIAPAQKSKNSLKNPNEHGALGISKTKKTEEQKYNEKQAKIDRETKKKLEEMEDEKKMEVLPSEMPKPVYQLRTPKSQFVDEECGKKTFILIKKDDEYKVGDIIERLEFDDGKYTGRTLREEITYLLEEYTGLVEDYCIMAIKLLAAAEQMKEVK